MSAFFSAVALDPEAIAKQIGRRIAELRQARGWTQHVLAGAVQSRFQWVSQVEAGRNLTIGSLVKIANALDVPLTDLLAAPDPANKRGKRGRPKKTA